VYSGEIERLARFLMGTNVNSSDLCRFLVLDTFADVKASAILIFGISGEGHLKAESSFGLPEEIVNHLTDVRLGEERPIVAGFRSNQFAVISRQDSKEVFPKLHEADGMPENVASVVLCPILPYGGFGLALNREPETSHELEMFFRAVGTLAALHFNRLQFAGSPVSSKSQRFTQNGKGELTQRQLLIKKLMESGYTNMAIANEIGYSESLVKQETMAIFSILKVSGRKELLNSSQDYEVEASDQDAVVVG
jgi:DNA-binding CsgD family transcriptional regulator